jgi:hypothetical protein
MIERRGYESALSACPAPAAAFAADAPVAARLRAAVTPFQGTGLPVAVQFVDVQQVISVRTMLVQPHPGDTARRPPA